MAAAPPVPELDRPITPPPFARRLDVLTLLLVALGVVVAVWGGFRESIGGVRIAVTSPVRLFLAALIAAVLRHALSPAQPIHRDLPARILTAWRSAPARSAWSAVAGTRPAILFVAYLAVVMFGYRNDRPPLRISNNEVANLQVRWDTAWYFGIATQGYRAPSNDPAAQQNIVFFPAYPVLLRFTGRLLGGDATSFMLAGTLLSLGAFFWALTYLFRTARDLLLDEDTARYAVWLLAAYPFAWFYSAVYTESLFLLGATAALFHFRHGAFWKAGAWGLLVGLTRPNGCFLSIPLAIMALEHWFPDWLRGGTPIRGRGSLPQDWRGLVPAIAAAAMPGIGVLSYSAFIWQLTGNPLAWAEGHIAWGREYEGLTVLITDRLTWLANSGVYAYTSREPGDLLNVLGALFVLVAAWPVARRFGLAYAIFILINILPPMAAGGMLSVGRFSAVLFPAFIWFASAVPHRHRTGWLASFMALQAFGAALFYTWRELY